MKIFNALCFAILMDHHRNGAEEAHPNYIQEKFEEFETVSEGRAFGMLDNENQQRVIRWCRNWNISLPTL